MAYEKLEEASLKMRAAISPKLSETAGTLMSAVTNGKYPEIGVDSVFSLTFRPETGNGGRMTKGEEFMSAGTSDAAYVSLRLALATLICGADRLPPMIFDESFSRLDDERLGNMLKLLAASRSPDYSSVFSQQRGGTCRRRRENKIQRREARLTFGARYDRIDGRPP